MNRIGLALMAAAAAGMIATDAFAGDGVTPLEPTPLEPTAQKFYLEFSTLAPTDIQCAASGPGVRSTLMRNIVGKPILRVTGNADQAQIDCWRSDGSRYTTAINRQLRYNSGAPVRAIVSFDAGRDAMNVVLERDDRDDLTPTVVPRAFVRVRG